MPMTVLDDEYMPRDRVALGLDLAGVVGGGGASPALVAFAHPATALRLRHPHSPVLCERTLGHRELDRDRRRHPRAGRAARQFADDAWKVVANADAALSGGALFS